MNTPQKGSVRCIIFKDMEENSWYGIALEFNIVESGDDPDVVRFNLDEAVMGYVESQNKIKGSRVAPLNQKPMGEYEELWNTLNSNLPVPSPYDVKYYGVSKI